MDLVNEQRDGCELIRIDGRLDAETAVQAENRINQLLEGKSKKVILDLAKVDYLSSAGIRLILSLTKKLKTEEGKLVVCNLHEDVSQIIKMAGFEQILNIATDENAAIGQF
ncbi:MAG: putative anti-sigma factor antagonist BtrV [Chlamydiia bacterium]|nr:putative anti-sigma factor antagonist BtrV [Chlamydiia bacterium]